jgi:anti-anti-sigma factor
MKIHTEYVPKECVVIYRIGGLLTAGPSAEDLQRSLARALQDGYRYVVFDLAEVNWTSTTGLGILCSTQNRVMDRGGLFYLTCPSGRMKSVLEITMLNNVFTVCSTEEDARTAIRKDRGETQQQDRGREGIEKHL